MMFRARIFALAALFVFAPQTALCDTLPVTPPARNAALIYTATHDLKASLVNPTDGGAASDIATTFDVRTGAGGGAQLVVNGDPVPETRIGKKVVDQQTGDTDWFFYGVGLKAGPNAIVLVPLGAGGLRGTPVQAVVYGPGEPVAMAVAMDRPVYANGRDPATISATITDRWRHPVAPRGKVRATIVSGSATFQASAVSPPILSAGIVTAAILQDKNAAQITAQDRVVDIGPHGVAVFPIVSGLQAGDVVVHIVADNGVESTFRFFMKPDTRHPLVVGILSAGFGSVPGLPGLAPTVTDGSDSRLARAAFFAKGAVDKQTLVTAAYETANRLNDGSSSNGPFVVNPIDRPYQTYGDNSNRDSNALSNARLFLRVDHGRSSAMYGNYTIDTGPLSGVTAGAYHADLSGVRVQVGGASTALTGFVAKNRYGFARVEFNPLGLGTVPLLLHTDIVVGSEQVLLVARDRRSGAVLSSTALTPNVDYLLDTSTGLIRFINIPLPYDQNFNPQTIVVTYQYQGANVTSSTSGFKFASRFGPAIQFNAGYANDATGSGNYTIANEDLRAALRGGEFSISHAQSNGIAGNVAILNGEQTPAIGGALIVDYHQKLGPMTLLARYTNTGQGFSSPFGGLGSPGLRQYSVGAARDFGRGGIFDVSTEAQRVVLDGTSNAASRTGAHYSKALSKNAIVRVGLQHVTQTSGLGPADTGAPATSSVQLDTGFAWKPAARFDVLVDRLTPLTGQSGSLYPAQTLIEAGVTMKNNGRAFIRQLWSDAPNGSLYSGLLASNPSLARTAVSPANGVGQLANVAGTTSVTEIGISRSLGVATTYQSGLILDNGSNVHDASWGQQLDERFSFGKGLTGDLSVQLANPLTVKSTSGGFAVYGLNVAYTNGNHLKVGAQVQQRNGSGNGSTMTFGATGPLSDSWNILGSSTIGNASGFSTHDSRVGLSWRPQWNDRGITLFEYNDYSGTLTSGRTQTHVVAIEQVYRPARSLEFGGRLAYKLDGDGYYTAHTLFYGARLTQKLPGRFERFDVGTEVSGLSSPGIGQTVTSAFATEIGFRALETTRVAVGYNFSGSADPALTGAPTRRGFYFTATSVVDRIFGWGKAH